MLSMQKKISDMLFERGKSLKDASLAIGKSHSYLQHYIKLGKPRRLPPDVRQRLAHFLNVSEEELLDSSVEPSETRPSTIYALPAVSLLIGDVPVLSRPSLGEMVIDRVDVSEYVSRPDYLRGVAEAFAVYMMDDTMEPRFYRGELLYCHPTRPSVRGDSVVIEFIDLTAIVRELVSIEPKTISVKQVTRPDRESIPRMRVKGIYRIMGARYR
jgi:phage repressor protein C with HTH and peptisase S24 domain